MTEPLRVCGSYREEAERVALDGPLEAASAHTLLARGGRAFLAAAGHAEVRVVDSEGVRARFTPFPGRLDCWAETPARSAVTAAVGRTADGAAVLHLRSFEVGLAEREGKALASGAQGQTRGTRSAVRDRRRGPEPRGAALR